MVETQQGTIRSRIGAEFTMPLRGREAVLDFAEQEASQKSALVIQGPELFCWPNSAAQNSYQRWQSESFISSWDLASGVANRVSGRVPDTSIAYYVVVDDLEGKPPLWQNPSAERQWELARRSSGRLAVSPIFLNGHGEHPPVVVITESELAKGRGGSRKERLTRFQIRSMLENTPEGALGLLFEQLRILTIGQWGQQGYQAQIFERLIAGMRYQEEFSAYTIAQRIALIEGIYRSVWITEQGSIDSITKPIWRGERFLSVAIPF